MRGARVRLAWTAAFVVAVLLPIVLRALSPERQLLGPELVTITGLLATVLIVATVVLPSRLRSLTRAFGIGEVLRYHRAIGLAAALFTLAHVAAVISNDPRGVGLILPFIDMRAPDDTIAPLPLLGLMPPGRALFGILATVCLVLLGLLSSRRTGRWERWRAWHLAATFGVLGGTALHILLIGHLIPTPAVLNLLMGDPLGWTNLWAATQDPLGASFLVLLALITIGVGVWRWFCRPAPFQVIGAHHVTTDVTSFALQPVRHGLRRFRPGQFVWLRVTKSPLLSEEHPFTISSAVQDRPTIEFTIRHTGDWTNRLRSMGPGDLVYVDGPHGSFTPNMRSRRGLVLIAGGIGITPAMSVLRTAARARGTCRYYVILADRPGQGLFRDELLKLTTQVDLIPFELAGRRMSADTLNTMLPRVMRDQLDYYICGSPRLVHDAEAALGTLGVSQRRVHTESFGT